MQMVFYGLLRVKNESRWISRVLHALQPLCAHILLLDDHSTDPTPQIAAMAGAEVIHSTFEGLDESRDKDYLQRELYRRYGPFRIGRDWALMIDGDEALDPASIPLLAQAVNQGSDCAYSLRILYLWNGEDQIRTDGVYARFRRPSLYPLGPVAEGFSVGRVGRGGFHCCSIPRRYFGYSRHCEAALLHFGYLDREMRLRKWDWYNAVDPHNVVEDHYRHMIQGDVDRRACSWCAQNGREHIISIPNEKLRHAGPVVLETYDAEIADAD